jgi:alcohol dehydrogenase class IV
MDFKKLADKAKDTIDKRGGVDSLKTDAEELKKVAKGGGSLADKAKAAAAAIKEPGSGKPTDEQRKAKLEGERHPAKEAGHASDTPRKGGPPHE